MKLVKAASLASVSALVVVMSYGCTATVTTVTDGDAGSNGDSGFKKDAAQNNNEAGNGNEAGGNQCGPADVSAFMPRAYSPPSGKHQGKCTTQNITDYVACIEQTDKTKCAQFGQGQPAEACGNCIETNQTDPAWGPFVSPDGQNLAYNTPGCLDLAAPMTMGCGKALDASYGCQDAACGTCDANSTPTYDSCVSSALTKGCKTVGDAADKACAVQFGDSAPSDVSNCFPDPSISDPAAQDADFVKRITTFFCGPA
jgi:hypothetical protein